MKPVLAAIALTSLLIACADRQAPAPTVARADPPAANADAGAALAERACKACHGADGQGAAPGIPRLASQRAPYLVASLTEYRNGTRSHASQNAMSQLGDGEVRDLAAHYARLSAKPREGDARAADSAERGRKLGAACTRCHGDEGNARKSGVPTLAGQQPHYLANAFRRAHRSDGGAAFDQDAIALQEVSLYFSSRTPVRRAAPPAGDADAGRAAAFVCGGCHGPDGVSRDATTASLAGQDFEYLARALKRYRATRQHAALDNYIAGLSDRSIADVAAFYATREPRAAESGSTGVRDVADKCDRCHDAGDGAVTAPVLRGQDRDYLVMSLRAYRDGRRGNSSMHVMSSVYGDVLIDRVASWYASQPDR